MTGQVYGRSKRPVAIDGKKREEMQLSERFRDPAEDQHRKSGNGRRHTRARTTLRTVVAGLTAAVALAVTPGAAPAAPSEATAPAAEDVGTQALYGVGERIWYGSGGQPLVRAHATFSVYTDHKKVLWICDSYRGDGIGLGIEVDASGGGPPDTVVYWDQNGPQNGVCWEHTIGYSVRKWRFVSVYQNGSIHNRAHPWELWPLPWADF